MFSRQILKQLALILAAGGDFPVTVIRRDLVLAKGSLPKDRLIHRHEDYELRFVFVPSGSGFQRMDLIHPQICHASLSKDENDRSTTVTFAGGTFHFRQAGQESVQL